MPKPIPVSAPPNPAIMEKYSSSDKLAVALFFVGVAVAIILFLVEKTPAMVALLLVLLTLSLIYPVLHFFKRSRARVFCFSGVGLLVAVLGVFVWPHPKKNASLIPSAGPAVAPAPLPSDIEFDKVSEISRLDTPGQITSKVQFRNAGAGEAGRVEIGLQFLEGGERLDTPIKDDLIAKAKSVFDESQDRRFTGDTKVASGKTIEFRYKSQVNLSKTDVRLLKKHQVFLYVFSYVRWQDAFGTHDKDDCRRLSQPGFWVPCQYESYPAPSVPCMDIEVGSDATIEDNDSTCGMKIKAFDHSIIRNNKTSSRPRPVPSL